MARTPRQPLVGWSPSLPLVWRSGLADMSRMRGCGFDVSSTDGKGSQDPPRLVDGMRLFAGVSVGGAWYEVLDGEHDNRSVIAARLANEMTLNQYNRQRCESVTWTAKQSLAAATQTHSCRRIWCCATSRSPNPYTHIPHITSSKTPQSPYPSPPLPLPSSASPPPPKSP